MIVLDPALEFVQDLALICVIAGLGIELLLVGWIARHQPSVGLARHRSCREEQNNEQ
jgi:hypothetical protein